MKTWGTILVVTMAVGMAGQTFGWNSYGHMEVAAVAYTNLTAQTKQRVSVLLKLNPHYNTWSGWIPSGTSDANKDMMIFMMAATWPDEIKGQEFKPPPTNPATGEPYVSDGGDNAAGSTNATANTGYSDNSMHKYWHFVDTPFSTDGTALPPIPTPNAQERITLFRGVLASTSPDDLKSYDLSWLLHLVGDVHQPLHCATRVSSTITSGDEGGNLVQLTGSTNELHAVWDGILGTGSDKAIVTKVIKAAAKLPAPDPMLAEETDAQQWVTESFQLAKSKVYVSPIDAGNGPFTLSSTYESDAKAVAQKQIALAGIRLANLLNTELK